MASADPQTQRVPDQIDVNVSAAYANAISRACCQNRKMVTVVVGHVPSRGEFLAFCSDALQAGIAHENRS